MSRESLRFVIASGTQGAIPSREGIGISLNFCRSTLGRSILSDLVPSEVGGFGLKNAVTQNNLLSEKRSTSDETTSRKMTGQVIEG